MNLKSKSFSLGSSIVIPGKGVRYVYYGKGIYKLFHNNLVFCGNRDTKGFCIGHDIKRKEFIKKYCNGVVPEQMEIAPLDLTNLITLDVPPKKSERQILNEKCFEKYKRYKELRASGLSQDNALEKLGITQGSRGSFLAKGRRLLTKEETKKEVKKNDYNRIF